jgi:hypothetical protein
MRRLISKKPTKRPRSASRRTNVLVVVLMMVFVPTAGFSQDLQLGGFLRVEKRFGIGDIPDKGVAIEDFYNRLRIEVEAPLGESLYAFASIDVRFYDFPSLTSLKGLEELNQLFPADAAPWEAYIEMYEFLFPSLDLKFGKQRLAWGTADKLNPTDNLNPDDFSDLLDLGEKIPTWAVQLNYYLRDFKLTGIWLPALTPILLPRNQSQLFLGSGVSAFNDSIVLPDLSGENSMFAIKASGILGPVDLSLSYFNGYDDGPILRTLNLDTSELELGFYRMHVFGADFATELAGIGSWGEVAVFLPHDKVISETISGGVPIQNVELDNEPYLKLAVGFDYTLPFGLYINNQWMHGFFIERGADSINDYLFITLEQSLFNDNIKVSLAGLLEVDNWQEITDRYGYGIFTELRYLGIDNLEIALGAFIVDARPDTLFSQWKDSDQAYLRLKVSF